MRIYTRSGDKGTTSLVYGQRVPKNDLRVDAYGTCDEANSMIGFAIGLLQKETWNEKEVFISKMQRVQTILFHVGSELATPTDRKVAWELKEEHVQELEEQIDQWDEKLPALQNFILPSGHEVSGALHVARTIIRRAERIAAGLDRQSINPLVLTYINRLSDFLFVASRYINNELGGDEKTLHADL
ncbi:cob(I)yrinic acid a,c-diamide adenosyltransferase [Virgibacillus sp. W0181]|uniref:cob(I)yrinic acid a,c-diamide adenosyltransferase n=1 Tax=Virgibacillus sp. W0181 TaxID=3391581 RepID=UPI003F45E6C6